MLKTTILFTILLIPLPALSQLGRDTVLNERSIDRPIILHDRQMRISSGYNFSTLSSRFDENGDKIKLSSEGRASILHHVFLDLQYGFLDMLQLNVSFDYVSNLQREQPVFIFPSPDPTIEINENNRHTGMEDIFVGLDFMVPWKTRKMDLVFSGGVSVPTAKSETERPGHIFDDSGASQVYEYNNKLNRGVGVVKAFLGTQFKYRLTDLAFSVLFQYGFPTAETEDFAWRFRLVNGEFQYQNRVFNVAPPNTYLGQLKIEYQLYPWIDLFIDIEQMGTSGGWSDRSGQKIALPEERLTFINPGVEILLTTKFWLRQRILFPLEGENSFVPFSVQTALIYNFFPF